MARETILHPLKLEYHLDAIVFKLNVRVEDLEFVTRALSESFFVIFLNVSMVPHMQLYYLTFHKPH